MRLVRPAHRRDRVRASHHGDLVLVATDDGELRTLLCENLDAHGYRAVIADPGARTDDLVAQLSPVVVLFDLDSPDGLAGIVRIRRQGSTPVIAMTGDGPIEALARDAGAADSVAKPVRPKELLASLRVAIRRVRAVETADGIIQVGPIKIDASRHRVALGDRPVRLTPLELRLLEMLARFHGRVVTRERLLHELWPGTPAGGDPLRGRIAALRKKLEADPARPRWLTTVVKVGYRLGE